MADQYLWLGIGFVTLILVIKVLLKKLKPQAILHIENHKNNMSENISANHTDNSDIDIENIESSKLQSTNSEAEQMSNKLQIFIAHASEDKKIVRELYYKLQKEGFKPWLDEYDLLPGKNWRVEIPEAIRQSDIFLACLSFSSITKAGYIQREFLLALNTYSEKPPGEIFFIPVKLDNCKVPDIQITDVGIRLRDIHWVELANPNGFDRLIEAIRSKIPQHVIQRKQQICPTNLLRFTPTQTKYPTVEFSLVNISRNRLQITSLMALPCAKMKFETGFQRSIFGPRTRLSVDIRRAISASPIRVAGEDGVFNLAPGEADAFSIHIDCENTLNIICIVAEVVSEDLQHVLKIPLDYVILCAAASEKYSGYIATIPKNSLIISILKNDPKYINLKLSREISSDRIFDVCIRAVAFICDGDLYTWNALKSLYENEDEWGSIIASFAEYSSQNTCDKTVTNYLDEWLRTPDLIRKIISWDHEIRSVTVLENRIKQIESDQRGIYLLRLLDSTIFDDESHDPFITYKQFNQEDDITESLRDMSLDSLRRQAAILLAEYYGVGAVECLIAYLISCYVYAGIHEILENLTNAGIDEDEWQFPEDHAENWINWWIKMLPNFPSSLPLRETAPIMYRALQARITKNSYSKYVNGHSIVLRNLALNYNIVEEDLKLLAKSEHLIIRKTLARRKMLPLDVARILSNDKVLLVRRYLASNKNINLSILHDMLNDDDNIVRDVANDTIKNLNNNK